MPVSKRREKTTAASPLHAGLGMARGAHHVCNGPKEPLIPGIMPGASRLAGGHGGNGRKSWGFRSTGMVFLGHLGLLKVATRGKSWLKFPPLCIWGDVYLGEQPG